MRPDAGRAPRHTGVGRTLDRRGREHGYVALLTAIVTAALFTGLGATAVDTTTWTAGIVSDPVRLIS